MGVVHYLLDDGADVVCHRGLSRGRGGLGSKPG